MSRKEKLKKNLQEIENEINGVRLVAVTKYTSIEDIKILYELGHRDFGENKVQDLYKRACELEDLSEIRWHMIGPIQSNKVNKLLSTPNLFAIHSVGSQKIVEILNSKVENKINLFFQYNTSGEDEKSGFRTEEELINAIKSVSNPKVTVLGLMTIATFRTDDLETSAKECFQNLLTLKIKLDSILGKSLELSMGMSQDYKIAVKYQSDCVRIGSKLFKH